MAKILALSNEQLLRLAQVLGHIHDGCNDWAHECAALAIEELVARRLAGESPLRVEERSLAYESACAIIECNGGHVGAEHGTWFDLDNVDELAQQDVKRSELYLESRGLLERCEGKPNWVAPRDESEEG